MSPGRGTTDLAAGDGFPSLIGRWFIVFVFGLAVLLSFTDRLVINLVVDDVRQDLSLSDISLSVLLGGGFALMYAVAGIPLGRLADRFNRRNIVVGGIIIWSVATAGCGLAASFGQLLLARILVGLGEAALMPAAGSLIADSFPLEQRGRALGVFGIGGVLGSGIALGVGGLLLGAVSDGMLDGVPYLGELPPWRNLLVLAAFPAVPIIAMLLFIREPSRKETAGSAQSLGAMAKILMADRARIGRLSISFGAVAAGDYALMSWLPTLLRRDHGLPPDDVGQIVGLVVGASGVAGCLLSGWLADRVVKKHGAPARIRVMIGGVVLCFWSAGALYIANPVSLIIGAVGWVLGSVVAAVAGHVRLQEAVPNEMRGTALALSYMGSAIIGMGVGPTLAIFLASLSPGGSAEALGIGVALTCSLAALVGFLLVIPFPAKAVAHSEIPVVQGSA